MEVTGIGNFLFMLKPSPGEKMAVIGLFWVLPLLCKEELFFPES